MNNTPPP
jgi:hypothetical protein